MCNHQNAFITVGLDIFCPNCNQTFDPLDAVLGMAELKTKLDELTAKAYCGHPIGEIVTADEGTSYCRACEYEARMSEKKLQNKYVAVMYENDDQESKTGIVWRDQTPREYPNLSSPSEERIYNYNLAVKDRKDRLARLKKKKPTCPACDSRILREATIGSETLICTNDDCGWTIHCDLEYTWT